MGQVKRQQQKNIAITLVQNTWQDAAINTATIIQSCTYFTQDFCSSVTPRAAVQRGGEPGSATTAQLPLSFHVSRSLCVLDYVLQRYTSWTRKAKHIFFRTLLLFNLSVQYLFTGRSFTVRCADFTYWKWLSKTGAIMSLWLYDPRRNATSLVARPSVLAQRPAYVVAPTFQKTWRVVWLFATVLEA